jgi:hypothetical protein
VSTTEYPTLGRVASSAGFEAQARSDNVRASIPAPATTGNLIICDGHRPRAGTPASDFDGPRDANVTVDFTSIAAADESNSDVPRRIAEQRRAISRAEHGRFDGAGSSKESTRL